MFRDDIFLDQNSETHNMFIDKGIETSLWSPIINTGITREENESAKPEFTICISTHEPLMDTMQKDASSAKIGNSRAYMDAWVKWLVTMLNFDERGTFKRAIPTTKRYFLING